MLGDIVLLLVSSILSVLTRSSQAVADAHIPRQHLRLFNCQDYDFLHYIVSLHYCDEFVEEKMMNNMQKNDLISLAVGIVAVVVSLISAVSANKSAKEAMMANHYSRLDALLILKKLYEAIMNEVLPKHHEIFKETEAYNRVQEQWAEYDTKLREVNEEIKKYHADIMKSDIYRI
jgi:hypothetical protein